MENESERTRALLRLAQLLTSTLNLKELLTRETSEIARSLNAERGSLYLVDSENSMLWSVVTLGEESLEIRMPFGQGIAGHVAESEQGIIVKDAYGDEHFDNSYDRSTGFVTRDVLCLPVKDRGGQLIGVVQLLNKKEGTFTEEDRDFLAQLTEFLAPAVANATLYTQLRKQKEHLARFYEISRLIISDKSLEDVLQRIVELCMESGGAEAGSIILFDRWRRNMFFYSVIGTAETEIRKIKLTRGQGIAWSVAESGRGEIIAHVQSDPRFFPDVDKRTGFKTRTMICVPLRERSDVIGVMEVINKIGGDFQKSDLEDIQALADMAAAAITNARIYGEVLRVREYATEGLPEKIFGMIKKIR